MSLKTELEVKAGVRPLELCRTCLSSRRLMPLFPESEQFSRVRLALRLTTGLKIKLGDGLPQTICRKCSKFIKSAMKFRIRSRATEKHLLNMNYNYTREFEGTIKTYSKKNNIKNRKSSKYIDVQPLVHRGRNKFNVKENEELNFKPLGNNDFKHSDIENHDIKNSAIKDHDLKHSDIEDNDLKHTAVTDHDKKHNIEHRTIEDYDVKQNATGDADLKRGDIKEHNPKHNAIEDDDLIHSNKIKNEDHNLSDNDNTAVSSDDECLVSKCNKSDMNENNLSKVEEGRKKYLDLIEGPLGKKGPVQCKLCKKYSKNINSFEKHAMSHLGYMHLCEFCAKRFMSNANLLRHMRAKHGLARDDSFPCVHCDFKAIDKEQLVVHERRVHTKERPFVCDDCAAAFFTHRVLKQHITLVHTDAKPFQCDHCPNKYKLRCHLTNHVHSAHTKKYRRLMSGCPVCHKKYTQLKDVRKHMTKIHEIPLEKQGDIARFKSCGRDEVF